MNNIVPQGPECIPVMTYLRTDLVSQYSVRSDDFLKEMLSNVRVYSRQGIVQQKYVCLAVSCTGQAHALFLAS